MAKCLMDSLLGRHFTLEDSSRWIAFTQEGTEYVCCKLDTDDIQLMKLSVSEAFRLKESGKLTLEKADEPSYIFTEDMIDDGYKRRKAFVDEVMKSYENNMMELSGSRRKAMFWKIQSKHGFSRPGARHIMVRYLQDACSPISLVDRRTKLHQHGLGTSAKKRGRKRLDGIESKALTEADKQNMMDAILKYVKKDHNTLKQALKLMLFDHYRKSDDSFELVENFPTYRQFLYYFRSNFSIEEQMTMKLGVNEFRNNHRLLLGSANLDAETVGSLAEIDSVETDFSLVSPLDKTQYIGKCYLTALVDVKSFAITAISVSYENNSFLAFAMCMENLMLTDKMDLAERWGFTNFDPALWPSNYVPQRIRCDRGSDFKSKEGARMLSELGVQMRDLEPGATGSLKGVIENTWHNFQETYRPFLVSRGLISYTYGNDGKREACLTIEDATRMAIAYVLYHNAKPLPIDRLNSKDMVEHGNVTTPAGFWRYYTEHLQERAKPILPEKIDSYRFALMTPITATHGDTAVSISRKGIRHMGLYYTTDDIVLRQEMLGGERIERNWRKDLRDCSHLYYVENGNLKFVSLNESKSDPTYKGMTWAQYKFYWDKVKKMSREASIEALDNDMAMIGFAKTIAESASDTSPFYATTDGAREARTELRYLDNYSKSTAVQLGISEGHGSNEITGEETIGAPELPDMSSSENTKEFSDTETSFDDGILSAIGKYNRRGRK